MEHRSKLLFDANAREYLLQVSKTANPMFGSRAAELQLFIAAVRFGLHEPSLAHISMAMQIIISIR